MKAGCRMTENLMAGHRIKILWWEQDFLILIREMQVTG